MMKRPSVLSSPPPAAIALRPRGRWARQWPRAGKFAAVATLGVARTAILTRALITRLAAVFAAPACLATALATALTATLTATLNATLTAALAATLTVGFTAVAAAAPAVSGPAERKTGAWRQAAIPLATDFAAHARRASALDAPLIVLVSLRDCVYCGPIRQRELAPLVRSGKYEVREIGMDSSAAVRDFDGGVTTGAAWARAHGVKVSPTVLFLDTNGRPVADPLIGAGLPDFYGAYLDEAIARGRARLHAGSSATARGDSE